MTWLLVAKVFASIAIWIATLVCGWATVWCFLHGERFNGATWLLVFLLLGSASSFAMHAFWE